jgi:hypothetical protein
MAKAHSKLENFLAQVRTQHTPKSERFEVVFYPPQTTLPGVTTDDFRSISVYCEEAQIPGLVATNVPVKIGAWTEYRTQNVEFLTTDMTFTFLVDQNWEGRDLFEAWIALSANPYSKEVAYYEEVVGTVDIRSLSVNDDILAEWKLHDAVPKLINITPVSWNNTGFIRMSVSVSAKYWTREYANVGASAQDTRNIFGRLFDRVIDRIL